MRVKSSFLRKAARLDKREKLREKADHEQAKDIDQEVLSIIAESKEVFSDYSVVIGAFSIKKTLEELQLFVWGKTNVADVSKHIQQKLDKTNIYLDGVVKSMRKEL